MSDDNRGELERQGAIDGDGRPNRPNRPLTPEQLAAGRAVKRALEKVDRTYPRCPHVRGLHDRLAELRDAFRDHMPDGDFTAFGGGTPKDEEPEGDGG